MKRHIFWALMIEGSAPEVVDNRAVGNWAAVVFLTALQRANGYLLNQFEIESADRQGLAGSTRV